MLQANLALNPAEDALCYGSASACLFGWLFCAVWRLHTDAPEELAVSMAETEELPACRASLGLNAVCEADVEVRDACSKEVMLSREQRMMTMILHMRTCGLTPVKEQSTS